MSSPLLPSAHVPKSLIPLTNNTSSRHQSEIGFSGSSETETNELFSSQHLAQIQELTQRMGLSDANEMANPDQITNILETPRLVQILLKELLDDNTKLRNQEENALRNQQMASSFIANMQTKIMEAEEVNKELLKTQLELCDVKLNYLAALEKIPILEQQILDLRTIIDLSEDTFNIARTQQAEIAAAQHSASFFANHAKKLEQDVEKLGLLLLQKNRELTEARLDTFIASEMRNPQN